MGRLHTPYSHYHITVLINSNHVFVFRCRKTRGIFDKCVFEKLGIEKPELGYFSKVRVHDTKRVKPKRDIPLPEPTPDPPTVEDVPVPESAKQGTRFLFYP